MALIFRAEITRILRRVSKVGAFGVSAELRAEQQEVEDLKNAAVQEDAEPEVRRATVEELVVQATEYGRLLEASGIPPDDARRRARVATRVQAARQPASHARLMHARHNEARALQQQQQRLHDDLTHAELADDEARVIHLQRELDDIDRRLARLPRPPDAG